MTEGHHPWTEEEIAQFEARHAVGSKARLALALLAYTGVRRSDVVSLGRQRIRQGWLKFIAQKGRHRKPVTIEMPVIAPLQRALDAGPCGDLTFLMTDLGKPFTANGFGGWFRSRCDEAGLPQCSAHGFARPAHRWLQKTERPYMKLMAIFGWLTMKEAERYTQAARRRRLARNAGQLWYVQRTKLPARYWRTSPRGNRLIRKTKFRCWCPGAESNHRHRFSSRAALRRERPGNRDQPQRRRHCRAGPRSASPCSTARYGTKLRVAIAMQGRRLLDAATPGSDAD